MSRIVRAVASAALWALAVAGVLGGLLWAANRTGYVQPLIVVSGSMSPEIKTGDLLFATATSASDLAVGQVATIRSTMTGKYVTHRVVETTRAGADVVVRMKGDANEVVDPEQYTLAADARVWQPTVMLPGAGYAVANLLRPPVLVPFVLGVLALIALALFPPRGRTEPGDTEPGSTEPADSAAPDADHAPSRAAARQETGG